MTDRTPTKPGQYIASITASEFEKLQNGELFLIKLTRNDVPANVGTPYNKESVLPDELAAVICPDIDDPTPADAFAGLLPLNGSKAMAANLKMGGFQIKNVGDPVDYYDAAHKRYVDNRVFHENYLDNSDFSNPVNQRGKTSYNTYGEFTIDRWKNSKNSALTVDVDVGCLAVTNNGSATLNLSQIVPRRLDGKYVWLAVCLEDGTVYAVMGTVTANEVTSSTIIASGVRDSRLELSLRKTVEQYVEVRIGLRSGKSARIKWATLYEGEQLPTNVSVSGDMRDYVPNYIPKGYAAELMECMRYYQICSTDDVPAVDLRPPMVSEPEITEVSNGYAYSADI